MSIPCTRHDLMGLKRRKCRVNACGAITTQKWGGGDFLGAGTFWLIFHGHIHSLFACIIMHIATKSYTVQWVHGRLLRTMMNLDGPKVGVGRVLCSGHLLITLQYI